MAFCSQKKSEEIKNLVKVIDGKVLTNEEAKKVADGEIGINKIHRARYMVSPFEQKWMSEGVKKAIFSSNGILPVSFTATKKLQVKDNGLTTPISIIISSNADCFPNPVRCYNSGTLIFNKGIIYTTEKTAKKAYEKIKEIEKLGNRLCSYPDKMDDNAKKLFESNKEALEKICKEINTALAKASAVNLKELELTEQKT